MAQYGMALVGRSCMELWARPRVAPAVLVPFAIHVTPARGAHVTKERAER